MAEGLHPLRVDDALGQAAARGLLLKCRTSTAGSAHGPWHPACSRALAMARPTADFASLRCLPRVAP